MTWDEYYSRLYDWTESTQISRISAIDDFTDAEGHEVVEVAMSFLDDAASTRLMKKALTGGVHFTADDVENVLEYVKDDFIPTLVFSAITRYTEEQVEYISGFLSDSDYKRLCREDSVRYSKATSKKQKSRKSGLFAALLIALASSSGSKSERKGHHKHSGRCEGDCSKCPPHYGYRYGRWYYGRNHIYGCQFGGNKNP